MDDEQRQDNVNRTDEARRGQPRCAVFFSALVRLLRAYVFISRYGLAAALLGFLLCLPGTAVAGSAKASNAAKKTAPSVRFDDLGTIRAVELKRVYPVSSAYEVLRVEEQQARLSRSVNDFSKVNALEPGQFKSFVAKVQKIRAAPSSGDDDLHVFLTVVGEKDEKSLRFDPAGKLRPVYADLMALREMVLANGQ